MDRSELQCPPDVPVMTTPPPHITYTIFLDVTRSGFVVLSSCNIQVSSTIEESCEKSKYLTCTLMLALKHSAYLNTSTMEDSACLLLSQLEPHTDPTTIIIRKAHMRTA